MIGMTRREMDLLVYKYLGVDGGYLCWFSYNEHEKFYSQYCNLAIDVAAKRQTYGTTKKTFVGILEEAPPRDQASIIRGVLEKVSPDDFTPDLRREKGEFAERLKEIALRLEGIVVPAQVPLSTSESVQQALKDAQELLQTQGPKSAVDRAHTALHGHLRFLCEAANISLTHTEPTTQQYVMALLQGHPKLQVPEPRRQDIVQLFRSAGTIASAISTIRNRASVAHANELLGDAEAMLVINMASTIMQYIDRKLSAAN